MFQIKCAQLKAINNLLRSYKIKNFKIILINTFFKTDLLIIKLCLKIETKKPIV